MHADDSLSPRHTLSRSHYGYPCTCAIQLYIHAWRFLLLPTWLISRLPTTCGGFNLGVVCRWVLCFFASFRRKPPFLLNPARGTLCMVCFAPSWTTESSAIPSPSCVPQVINPLVWSVEANSWGPMKPKKNLKNMWGTMRDKLWGAMLTSFKLNLRPFVVDEQRGRLLRKCNKYCECAGYCWFDAWLNVVHHVWAHLEPNLRLTISILLLVLLWLFLQCYTYAYNLLPVGQGSSHTGLSRPCSHRPRIGNHPECEPTTNSDHHRRDVREAHVWSSPYVSCAMITIISCPPWML